MTMRNTSVLSYKMTMADASNPSGIIPVGRQFDFWGDAETELMILNDGDESLCLGYTNVELYDDIYVGDQMDFKATLVKVGNTSRTCKVQSFKVATLKSRIDKNCTDKEEMHYFEEPELVGGGTVVLVVKKHLQRGRQPDGLVIDPWKEYKGGK